MAGEYAALAAALGWAVSSVLTKPITFRLGARPIQATYLWLTTLLTIAVALAMGRLDDAFRLPALATTYFAVGAVIGAGGDLMLIRSFALGSVGYVITIATSLFIFFSALGGAIFLGDTFTPREAAGGAIILVGVILANVRMGPRSISPRVLMSNSWLRTSPFVLALGTAVLWAASLILWDLGAENVEPIAASAIANLAPGVIYLVLAIFLPKVRPVTRHTGDAVRLLVAGTLYAAGILSSMFALYFSTAGLTALLISSTPIFAVPLGALLLKERFSGQTLVGMGLCMMGVIVVLV